MSKSKNPTEVSNLDHYLSLLMTDDNALELFLVNPEKAEKYYGITKAERAVLRRVVSGLSNQSKNGFSIRRDYSSYRRSLRLLQNVLHKHSSEHLAKTHSAQKTNASYTSTVVIYLTGNVAVPGAPVNKPSLAYQTYLTFPSASSPTSSRSIADAMYFAPPSNPNNYPPSNPYTTYVPTPAISQYGDKCSLRYQSIYQNGEWYVISFTVSGSTNSNLQNGTYKLLPKDNTTQVPFWYYSVNGEAIIVDPSKIYGYGVNTRNSGQGFNGQSFTSYPVSGYQPICWQGIAPDQAYGYAPCYTVKPDFSRTK